MEIDKDLHVGTIHANPADGRGGQWNREWREFFGSKSKRKLWDIMDKLGDMSRRHGLDQIPIRRYSPSQ